MKELTMPSLNKVSLIGNVGKDPEIRRTLDGRPIAKISLATTELWRDKTTGERRETKEWHRVVVMNETIANVVEKTIRKGALLFVEGRLTTRKWTSKTGDERYSTEVVLQGFNAILTRLDECVDDPNT
jgi:single-strand DNA-binding protein